MRRLENQRYLVMMIVMGLFFAAGSLFAAETELSKIEKELNTVRNEYEAYKKSLLENPEIAELKKDFNSLLTASRAKEKEFVSLMDSKINKNQTYLDLVTKEKEFHMVSADLRKTSDALRNDPEVTKLIKEAAFLRAKATSLEQEAKKIIADKIGNDPKIKELNGKLAPIGKISQELAEYRKNVNNDPQVKDFKAELEKMRESVSEKNIELRDATDDLLKNDDEIKTFEQTIKDLNNKISELRKAPKPVQLEQNKVTISTPPVKKSPKN